jgi:hypothetical protein
MDKIKSFSGKGKVFSGDRFLSNGQYAIDVYQEFIEGRNLSGASYRVPGMKEIVGTMRGERLPIGSILELVTSDGDTLNFFIADGNGTIRASGPFLTKDGHPVL